MEKQEILKVYDQYVDVTIKNIYSLSKKTKDINIKDFDIENQEHLFILSCAFLARDVFQKELRIDMPFIERMFLNHVIRKGHLRLKKVKSKDLDKAISCNWLIDFEKPYVKEWLGEDFSFADIYKEYFEGNFNNGKL